MADPPDQRFLARAADLARDSQPHPNPRVGAVLVKDGREVGEGVHAGPGTDHAEVVALNTLSKGEAVGATMYVTLEPCAHHGRTPPCVDAIVAAGVARVVIGEVDPDGQVSGRGIAELEEAGVEVVMSAMPGLYATLDPAYVHHRTTGRARITLKAAVTLDGQLAAADGTSQWITGTEARGHGHALRAAADAVIIGAGTLIADDPRLDVRLDSFTGRQPRPVVVAGRRPLPHDRQLWERNPLVVAGSGYTGPGEHVEVSERAGRPDLRVAAERLADLGYLALLAEGGAGLARALWDHDLVDAGVLYLGAKLAGGSGMAVFGGAFATLTDARPVEIVDVGRLGPDAYIEFKRSSP